MAAFESNLAYEPDGDSIFGALLPNVYISSIRLEPWTAPDGSALGAYPGLNIPITFSFKEKIEPDDVSLFSIDKITKSLRLRIVRSLDATETENILNGGMTTPSTNNGNTMYDQKKLAKYLASNEFLEYQGSNTEDAGPTKLFIETFNLSEVAQQIGLFGLPPGDPAATDNTTGLWEILSDGTQIYNTLYNNAGPTIYAALGPELEVNHLSVFAVTYVDFEALLAEMGASDEQQFVNNKHDQLTALGYNIEDNGVSSTFNSIKFLFENYGIGIPMKFHVILNGKVQAGSSEFVYSDGPKKGKVWNGLVHYHGQHSPGEYEGWMGGTLENMAIGGMLTPKLTEAVVPIPGNMIKDLRNLPDPPPLAPPPPEPIPYVAPVFSNALYSLHPNGESSFVFSFDPERALEANTAFPAVLAALKNSNPNTYATLLKNCKIELINISRQQMGTPVNDKGEPILDPEFLVLGGVEAHNLIDITTSSDGPSGLLYGATPSQPSTSVQNKSALNGTIREINLSTNNPNMRHFGVTDKLIAKNNEGVFQYFVDVELTDPVGNWINLLANIASAAKQSLKSYVDFIDWAKKQIPSAYNEITDTFSHKFAQAYFATHTNDTAQLNNLFIKDPLYFAMATFMESVPDLWSLSGLTELADQWPSLLNPLHLKASDAQFLYEKILTYESALQDLISTHPSNMDSASANEETESSLSGAAKDSNVFKLTHVFNSLFDTNADATTGYEYVLGDETSTLSSAGAGPASLTLTDYFKRVKSEVEMQGWDGLAFDYFSGDPAYINPAYVSPLFLKAAGQNKKLAAAMTPDQMKDLAINLITPDQNGVSILGDGTLFGPGVSVELPGSNREKEEGSAPPADMGTSDQSDPFQRWEDAGADGNNTLGLALWLSDHSLQVEDYYVLTNGGYPNQNNEIGAYINEYQEAELAIPNQVKNLLDSIVGPYIQAYETAANIGTTADADAYALVAKNNAKELFDTPSNIIKIILRQCSLMRVDIFDGFSVLKSEQVDKPTMSAPMWSTLTQNKLLQLIEKSQLVGSKTYVLARLRSYDRFGSFAKHSSFPLPLFNEHFLIELSVDMPSQITKSPAPPPRSEEPASGQGGPVFDTGGWPPDSGPSGGRY